MKRKLYACVVALSCIALGLAVTACSRDKEVQDERGAIETFSTPSESSEAVETEAEPTSSPTGTPKPTPVMRLVSSTMYTMGYKFETPHGCFGEERYDENYSEYNESGNVSVSLSEGNAAFYEYNENDQIIRETIIGDSETIVDYEYDGDKLVHKTRGGDFIREDYVYEYDDSGVMVASICDSESSFLQDPPNKLCTKTLYTYDSEGRVINEEVYYWDGSSLGDLYYAITYEYDSDGKLIRDETYNADINSNYIREYEYDWYGTLSKLTASREWLDPDMPESSNYSMEFFYENVYEPIGSDVDDSISDIRSDE